MASSRRSDGEGSVFYDRSRDRWVGVYVSGWRDGKPIRKKVSAKSKAGAASKLRELREKVTAGDLPVGRPPTIAEWAPHWLDEIAARKVRPSTLRGYRTSVTQYIVPLLGDKRLDRLTPEHIEEAWDHLMTVGNPVADDPRPLSSTSAHQAHRALARCLRVAQQRGLVRQNVATLIDAPQPADTDMQVLDLAQAERVLAAAAGRRNAARWRVALAAGLRQGEALGLQWKHVDLDAGTIAVRQALGRVTGKGVLLGPVKSRAGRRTVPLPAKLRDELRAHRTAQSAERLAAGSKWVDGDFVFAQPDGRPITPGTDWRHWKQILAEADVPAVRLHDARHSAATMMLAAGIPQRVVQEMLGHSRITQTAKYQHVLDELQKDAASKLDAYWG